MIKISKIQLLGCVIAVIGFAAYTSVYFIPETQNAIQLRSSPLFSGEQKALSIKKPGLYFKQPFDKIIRWDTRIQHHNFQSIPLTITEAGAIRINLNIMWRIQKIDHYIASIDQLKLGFSPRLQTWMTQYLQSHWQATTLHEALDFSFDAMKHECIQFADNLGIEILAFNVLQKQAAPTLRQNVIQNMSAHHKDLVQSILNKGRIQTHAIRTQAQTDRAIMLANARVKCDNIKNQGEALATQMHIEAYRKNPKFAFFYQRLMSYERSFNTRTPSMIVMQTDGPLLL